TTSQYLVAMPTRAVHHIQNSAPGPPRKMAVATPAILPVPTVAARQVISAWKGLISPSAPGSFLRPCHIRRKPRGMVRQGMNLRLIIRNSPVPRISTRIGGPHTSALISLTRLFRNCMSTPFVVLVYGMSVCERQGTHPRFRLRCALVTTGRHGHHPNPLRIATQQECQLSRKSFFINWFRIFSNLLFDHAVLNSIQRLSVVSVCCRQAIVFISIRRI